MIDSMAGSFRYPTARFLLNEFSPRRTGEREMLYAVATTVFLAAFCMVNPTGRTLLRKNSM